MRKTTLLRAEIYIFERKRKAPFVKKGLRGTATIAPAGIFPPVAKVLWRFTLSIFVTGPVKG
jgi:hypothetical protein